MSKQLLTSYTFTPGAANAGTVVVPGTYTLEQFLLITNVTSGTILYQFNVPSKGAVRTTGGGNTTLTLEFSTQSMNSADRLQIFIDDLTSPGGGSSGGGLTDAQLRATPVPVSDAGGSVTVDGSVSIAGTAAVSAASLPLPSGAATAANQATEIASLGNIDADLGAPADAAATSDTGTFSVIALIKRGLTNWTTLLGRVPSLTVSSTRLLVDGSGVTQPVSGPLTDTQLRATAVPVSGTFYQATQPISGSVSITGTAAVSGPLTDTQLRATAVPVSGTFYQATQPVSGTITANAGTNLNTSALALETGGNLATLAGRIPANLSVKAASTAAVATDSSLVVALNPNTIPTVSQSGTWTVQPGNTANTTPWLIRPSDGTNSAAIKAASTAVVATDPALVVGISPNTAVSAIPASALNSTYNVAGVITINTVLLTPDCSQYRSISIQCTSMGTTGVVTPEWSNDNATWVAATVFTQAGASATTISAAGLWVTPVYGRYLRLRLSTATTAGTTTFNVYQFDVPLQNWFATQPVSLATNTPTLAAGTNLAADVGIQVRANATGAATVLPCQSPATPAIGTIKASAGRLLAYELVNTAAALRYVKLFNATAPTLGTTAALIEVAIPAGARVGLEIPAGLAFSTAIVHTVTSGKGLSDNTSTGLAAADVVGWFAFA